MQKIIGGLEKYKEEYSVVSSYFGGNNNYVVGGAAAYKTKAIIIESCLTNDPVAFVNNIFNTNFVDEHTTNQFMKELLTLPIEKFVKICENISEINEPIILALRKLFYAWKNKFPDAKTTFCPLEPVKRMRNLLRETSGRAQTIAISPANSQLAASIATPQDPPPVIPKITLKKNETLSKNLENFINIYKSLYEYLDKKEKYNIETAKRIEMLTIVF